MKERQIVRFARDIRDSVGAYDPFIIAERYGINVANYKSNCPGFVAHTFKVDGYPTMISVNGNYSQGAQLLLCAHELGHALMHSDKVNNFGNSLDSYIKGDIEYEANLFAIALLFDDDEFIMPVHEMDDEVLRSIFAANM